MKQWVRVGAFAAASIWMLAGTGCSETAPQPAPPNVGTVYKPQDIPAPVGLAPQPAAKGPARPVRPAPQDDAPPVVLPGAGPLVTVSSEDVDDLIARVIARMPTRGSTSAPVRGLFSDMRFGTSGEGLPAIQAAFKSPPTVFESEPGSGTVDGKEMKADLGQSAHFHAIIAGDLRDQLVGQIEQKLRRAGYAKKRSAILGEADDAAVVQFDLEQQRVYLAARGPILLFVREEAEGDRGFTTAYGAQLVHLFLSAWSAASE